MGRAPALSPEPGAPLDALPRKPLASVEPRARDQRRLWASVLAGGEGVRLRPLTRRLHGEDRPKQYAVVTGSRSLLRHTLDRVALAIPPERTVVVTLKSHARYVAAEFGGAALPWLLAQPEDRGTAAGVLYAAHWIARRDPESTLAFFPSDHFILEESAFMTHVTEVAAIASGHPEWIVLLGAEPTEPETEYGWIEPGEPLDRVGTGPIWRVRRFWEKPSREAACDCLQRGCLWNTLVVVGKASALLEVGRRFLPELHDRLAWIAPFTDTDDEAWAVREAYARAPRANFSHAILEPCPPGLVVSRLPRVTWSDWGTPERVLRSLERAGIAPPWLTTIDRPA